jgi:hypothetical protein
MKRFLILMLSTYMLFFVGCQNTKNQADAIQESTQVVQEMPMENQ